MFNQKVLNAEVQHYIAQKAIESKRGMAIMASPFEGISPQELGTQITSKRLCIEKLPLWGETQGVYYPSRLSVEQASSEATAIYKASLVSGNLLDATGGLGVDSFYFAQKCTKVTHCELYEELSVIAEHNFKVLGAKNIQTVSKNVFNYLKNISKSYNYIYFDPARRLDGEKIISLESSTPNVLKVLPTLWQYTQWVLLKTSPMLDITKTIAQLKGVQQIHIVSLYEEVKELLFLISSGECSSPLCKVVSLNNEGKVLHSFSFIFGASSKKNIVYGKVEAYLYQPHSALMKSGGFAHIAQHYGLKKLGLHTHLFTNSSSINNFFGRKLKVTEVLPLSQAKKTLKGLKARVVARNFPLTVQQIRQKWQINEGEELHLYFTTNSEDKKIVIFCTD